MQNYSKISFFIVSSFALAGFLASIFLVPSKSALSAAKQLHVATTRAIKIASDTGSPLLNQADSKNFIDLPILMYHHVGDVPPGSDGTRRDLTVSAEDFKKQVEWLKQSGYESVTLNQLQLRAQDSFVLPKKPIIFTFDDGYSDVFENAVPILAQYRFTGSFAVITQFTGLTNGTNTYANWDQITQAQKQGMEIVSHTQNHFDGTSLQYNSQYIYQNLLNAREDLLAHGISSDILIYPYGHYNLNYITLAKKAGYNIGLTVRFGITFDPSDLMEIPRVRVHGNETLQHFEDVLLDRNPSKVATSPPDIPLK